jgi:glucokinase
VSDVVLAIDFGGTQTRAAVVNREGQLLSRARADTLRLEGPEAVILRVKQTARSALAGAGAAGPQIAAVGISAPGPINPYTGVIYTAPNMPGWTDIPIAQLVADEFGLRCFAGNDGNLAALGEWQFGAGRGCHDLVYLTISTGIGSGVVSRDQLIVGKDGLASEAGHMVVEPDGPACGCGSYGHLEALSSGTSIARIMEERLAAGEPSSLQASRGQVDARRVSAAALQGDALAADVFRRAAEYLGLGIASLIDLFNPEIVILGGGVTNAGELLFAPVRAVAFSRCMPMLGRGVRIVRAGLGDDVGLLGAAVYAFSQLEADLIRSPARE